MIQLANALLHVLAHFIKSLRGPRDLVFSTLAFPIGSIVVYTFWLVWFVAGREAILPAKLDPFYPLWLNHSSHTVIVPINMIMAYLVHHKYSRKGVLLTLGYTSLYVAFLHVIKVQTGLFVYGYLNDMNDYQRLIYFACSAVFAYLMYKSGQLLTRAFHGGYASAPQQQQRLSPKKQKQK